MTSFQQRAELHRQIWSIATAVEGEAAQLLRRVCADYPFGHRFS